MVVRNAERLSSRVSKSFYTWPVESTTAGFAVWAQLTCLLYFSRLQRLHGSITQGHLGSNQPVQSSLYASPCKTNLTPRAIS